MNYPIHFGLEKTGLPLILTTESPKNLCFLIDTGSTNDVIFDFVYDHFKDYFTLTDESQNIMSINGSIKSSFIVNADLHFDDLRYKAPFVVLEANDAITQVQAETGIQIQGILGTPFLLESKCMIDFDNLTIQAEVDDSDNTESNILECPCEPSLTKLQQYILYTMYDMGLLPNSKPIATGKVIGRIISNTNNYFSDSIDEHVEALYEMAQPWMIGVPLIECRGNMGCPELRDYIYSGAASPAYTDIRLTKEGIRYIEAYQLQSIHLPI